ncbi:MAG: protein translocase subunit SecD [Holosporaceae bacterium]|jgi:preprotein translocase subunit SecD|nr:protein translocase subunit SecD [Holosporaceae bacterium]
MNFSKWKEILIAVVCVFGVLFALPNMLSHNMSSKLPSWMPNQRVYLGLDLRGGAHLLLEVDMDTVVSDYLNQILDEARSALRKESIPYGSNFPKGIARGKQMVEFDLKDTSKVGKARTILGDIDPNCTVEIKGVHVKITPTAEALQRRKSDAVDRSIEIVRKRVDETGTRETNIQKQGDDRILLQIPGLQDPSHVKEMLGRTAKMTFRLVDETAPEVSISDTKAIAPLGSMYLKSKDDGKMLAVKKQVAVGGEALIDARLAHDDFNRPAVSFRFNKFGAKKFADITMENRDKRFAIILDNQIISAPKINDPIPNGSGIITSDHFTVEEAQDLALLMRAGALPAPLNIIEEKTVGPDLGSDSIRSGIFATLLSCVFVLIFMFMWYSSFGMIANVAVMFNLLLLIAGLSCLQATLTLPGIAGIALTIGMAVDANVLINERIKEHLRKGAKFVKAIEEGYALAMTSIVDSNLNTIIGMACLYYVGTGPVKGFAITTILGTVISFFTSTTFTRYIISWLLRLKYRVTIPM